MKAAPKIISDETGKELDDHLIVSVERPGYMIRFPYGDVTNRAIFEVEVDSKFDILKNLVYEPTIMPGEFQNLKVQRIADGRPA